MTNAFVDAAIYAVRKHLFATGFWLGWCTAFVVNTAVVIIFF